MLKRIIRKRTKVETDAWQQVQDLIPRGRKTRGIQYIALDYLFSRLYERVPEEDIYQHLLEVKGKLQATGDPVKGAINMAVKELQRLPERPFELVKIQETTHTGQRRLVQLNFTRFEEVINYDLFKEYLREVLQDTEQVYIRAVNSQPLSACEELFPGLSVADLGNNEGHFLINPHAPLDHTSPHIKRSYLPRSAANIRLLLIYEEQDSPVPFLGFVASLDLSPPPDQMGFILYRGSEKLAKLKFLNHLWDSLAQAAVDGAHLEQLKQTAQEAANHLPASDKDWYTILLDGLLAESMSQISL